MRLHAAEGDKLDELPPASWYRDPSRANCRVCMPGILKFQFVSVSNSYFQRGGIVSLKQDVSLHNILRRCTGRCCTWSVLCQNRRSLLDLWTAEHTKPSAKIIKLGYARSDEQNTPKRNYAAPCAGGSRSQGVTGTPSLCYVCARVSLLFRQAVRGIGVAC